ncbi:STAS domain-containing protein [Hydrogenophaga sp. 5NK40-0174]|uniref:STAS domain-containing protein n=1 Tax=Hydrogenophaga sp. 5NK40-0174 TaxID=3127649 RepID=UPI00333F1C63
MTTTSSSLKLPAQLTIESVAGAMKQLRLAADGVEGGRVMVDASTLKDFDTASVAALLDLRRHLHRNNRTLQVVGIPEHLKELIRLYGVSELLTA